MKNFKKIMALMIAGVMTLATGSIAFAGDASITIKKGSSHIADGHTYSAYQIFSGTLSDDGKTLSNIQWGDGVDDEALLNALKAAPTAETSPYKGCTTAQDVSKVLATFSNDSAEIKAFNDIVAANLDTVAGTSNDGVISGLDNGYYFVKDTTTHDADYEGTDALSAYIVQLIGTAEIDVKADAPSIEKKIVEGSAKVDANNASVGDDVDYILTSAVPDMSDFRAYEFFMQDDVSDGLTLNKATAPESTFTVKVGDTELVEGTDYVVTYDSTDADDFTIKFLTLYSRFNSEADADADFAAGTAITVEYSAKINKDAVIGVAGNPNKVKLIYTNDANWDGEGTPDDDQPVGPHGETPWDIVKTYITEIDILKRDGDTTLPLKDVTFDISGDSLNEVITYTVEFAEKAEADFKAGETKYYKLKDGTYTTTASTADTAKYYDEAAATKIFAKTETVSSTQAKASNKITMTTGDDGSVKFAGLAAGTYTIHETAPDGYNAVGDITVTITCTEPETITSGSETCTWEFAATGTDSDAVATDANHITITIDNFKGAVLPSTGGIGTTIFYVLGAILVLGAAVMLVTKRRMSAN